MEAKEKELLIRATQGLQLKDISLFDCKFERPTADTGEMVGEVFQQHKRGAAYTTGCAPAAGPDAPRLLQVRVSLGTRVVRAPDEDDPRPLFVIEATYLVEYLMTDDVPDDALKAFAEFNAIHNVWPFWRQHVFDIVDRGRLPRLEVPLYEGVAF